MLNNRERLFAASDVVEAGDWRAELRSDELAEISFCGVPVLRGIRAVVRDRDWQTLVPVVRGIERAQGEGRFALYLDIDFAGFGCRYSGRLALHFATERLEVTFDGEAPAAFQSNRIGLVVLHRPDEAGQPIIITTPGGESKFSQFPVAISPHQPFHDVTAMQWERDGATFRIDFTGDVFETEDQRNWTDASFKTYSRPLALPFPMDIPAGGRVSQSLTLTASVPEGRGLSPAIPGDDHLVVTGDVAAVVPALSLSAAGDVSGKVVPPSVPGLESLLVELVAGDPCVQQRAREAIREAKALDVPLDVRLSVDDPEEITTLLSLLPSSGVIRLAAFSSRSHVTEPALWDVLESVADGAGFRGQLIAGARSHFTELNRNATNIPSGAAGLTYSVTPQMHATEVPHIVESLQMQGSTAANALRIAAGRPLHIGPVTLKPRFNAVATSVEADVTTEPTVDPLQSDPFTAAWLLGSIEALSIPGVQSISYFETVGARGIGTAAGLTPAGQILAALAARRGRNVLGTRGTRPGLVLYPVQDDDGIALFAANLTKLPKKEVLLLPDGAETDLVLEPWTATIQQFVIERRNS